MTRKCRCGATIVGNQPKCPRCGRSFESDGLRQGPAALESEPELVNLPKRSVVAATAAPSTKASSEPQPVREPIVSRAAVRQRADQIPGQSARTLKNDWTLSGWRAGGFLTVTAVVAAFLFMPRHEDGGTSSDQTPLAQEEVRQSQLDRLGRAGESTKLEDGRDQAEAIAAFLSAQQAAKQQADEAELILRAVREAQTQMKAKAKNVLLLAYPSSTYQGVEYKHYDRNPDGTYTVAFDIEYQSNELIGGNINYLEVVVILDSKGGYVDSKWGRTTGAIPPGSTVAALGELLENIFRE